MSLFCNHDFRPKKVLHGESLIDECWAVAFYCVHCDKRKIGKKFSNREAAEKHLEWLLENTLRGVR